MIYMPSHLRGFVLAKVAAILVLAVGALVAGPGGFLFALIGIAVGTILRYEAEEASIGNRRYGTHEEGR